MQVLAESQLGRENSQPGVCLVLSYVSHLDKKTRRSPGMRVLLPTQMVSSLQLSCLSLCKAGREPKKDVGSAASYASEKSLQTTIKIMEKNSK